MGLAAPRPSPGRLALAAPVAVALFAAAAPLPAEVLELPAELGPGADALLLFELDRAEIHLTSRAEGVPVIRARALEDGEGARLEAVSEGGSLTLRRAGGEDAAAPRLRIDGVLGPGRSVRVEGADLTVRVEDPVPAGGDEATGRLGVHLVLARSRVDVSGVRNPRLELTDSSGVLSSTRGTLALALAGGSADVRGHQGGVELQATDAAVAVADPRGPLNLRLERTSLEVVGGLGNLTATAADAELYLDGWMGTVELRGTVSTLDARGSDAGAVWKLEGRELQVTLEELRATLGAELAGGALRGRSLQGSLRVAARDGASVELAEVAGRVVLELSESAEAWLTGLPSDVDATVKDSRLTAEGVAQLSLSGERADVTAAAVAHLAKVEMRASRLQLDLRGTERDAALSLQGPGRAAVRLSAPCVVLVALDAAVEVNGCELRPPGHRVSRQQDRARYGTTRPIRLTAALGAGAELEVEGEP